MGVLRPAPAAATGLCEENAQRAVRKEEKGDGRAVKGDGRVVEFATPARSEALVAASAQADSMQEQHTGAKRQTLFAILKMLMAAAVSSLLLGIPASVLLVAGFGLPEISVPVRACMFLAALPFAALRFLPRVNKLRFNLEEFAKVLQGTMCARPRKAPGPACSCE